MSNDQNAPHLAARGLRKGFRPGADLVPVLRGVDLTVARGETVFLCGASGAGKSTLLYTLAGLEAPDAGSVQFEGTDLYTAKARQQARLRNERMGFVFQSYMLLPELTALENVMLPGLIGGRDRLARATALMDRVGLGHRRDHLPAELSGGEQQRVAIARALINDPGILFADEPTGNLDSRNGAEIAEILLSMAREHGKTLVVVTHDHSFAALGDRVLHILDGMLDEQAGG